MKWFVTLLLGCSATLFGNESALLQEESIGLQAEPSSFVNGVNMVTGFFHHASCDLTIPGHSAINLSHFYSSNCSFDNWMGKSALSTNFPTKIIHTGLLGGEPRDLSVESSQGSFLHYRSKEESLHSKKRIYYIHPKTIHKGLSNTGGGQIGGRTNLKNSYFYYSGETDAVGDYAAKLSARFGDGTRRKYESLKEDKGSLFNLKLEKLPNGTRLHYKYDKDKELKNICLFAGDDTTPIAWLDFDYDSDKKRATVTSSNGKSACFHFLKHKESGGWMKYPEKIESSDRPTEEFEYTEVKKRHAISKIRYGAGRFLEIHYDSKGRVSSQRSPLGRLWSFYYHDYQTEAIDGLNHKTLYHYSTADRLTIIDRYMEKRLLRRERFFWGERASLEEGHHDSSDEGHLIGKALMNSDDKALVATTYRYDDRGNIRAILLYGNLTGKGKSTFQIDEKGRPSETQESYKKELEYSDDGMNLPLQEREEDGSGTLFQYKKGTSLLSAKFITFEDRIKQREFYQYDDKGSLTEKIVDDGTSTDPDDLSHVTIRKVTKIKPVERAGSHGTGLPAVAAEYAYDLKEKTLHLLNRTEYSYDYRGLLTAEKHFDKEGAYLYTIASSYDEKGHLITRTDAIGREWKYEYDENGNKTYEKLSQSGVAFHYSYDKMNQLQKKQEKHSDGTVLEELYEYDIAGNCIAEIDIYGNRTQHEYDDLNRKVKTLFPHALSDEKECRPTIELGYDEADNIIKRVDQNKNETQTRYNCRKQPLLIRYADGTKERFEYNPNGTLKHKWQKNGTRHSFTYDYQKRVVEEKVYDEHDTWLYTLKNRYSAFCLLSNEDAMGIKTEYSYDYAGRVIEVRKEEQRTTFEYDALGRKTTTKRWHGPHSWVATVVELDFLDRVVEEREEHHSGTLLSKKRFRYDIRGNQIEVATSFFSSDVGLKKMTYNCRNELISLQNEDEAITSRHYNRRRRNTLQQNVLEITTTDPLQRKCVERFDALLRLVSVRSFDRNGLLLEEKELVYDAVGNKTKEIHHRIHDGVSQGHYIIHSLYDEMNRIKELTEESTQGIAKKTLYKYTKSGFLEKLTQPNGVTLTHSYDARGNLALLRSSDGTVGYEYSYDKNNNPIRVVDLVHNVVHRRSFNAHNMVIEDAELTFSYDARQRLETITLPDLSKVRYSYSKGRLGSVQRLSSSGKELYRHTYTSFDLAGHVLTSKLIGAAGEARATWDLKGRQRSIQTPHWAETIHTIDGLDNIKRLSIRDPNETVDYAFDYDGLSQLIQENEHTYQYDSLHNRLKKDNNACTNNSINQLLSDSSTAYSYDKNGNLIQKTKNGKVTHFRYDALNRLIEVEKEQEFLLRYIYDSLNRRIKKERSIWKNGAWTKELERRFFFLGERELGALDTTYTIVELRVLGRGVLAELGAAVAIELGAKTYCPIHDHRGNVVVLLDATTGLPAETIRYTAFGQEKTSSSPLCPWRFASKRFEEETGLLFFGRRFYDPSTGRWISPDPAGFSDGANLYAYVRNRPLFHIDPYGLKGLSLSSNNQPKADYSNVFVIDGWTLADGSAIVFINGQDNFLSNALDSGKYLSELGGGIKVFVLYNQTHGIFTDFLRSFQAIHSNKRLHAGVVQEQCWKERFDEMSEGGEILNYSHSQGAPVTKNTLGRMSQEHRDRIQCITIAPAQPLTKADCPNSKNIESKRDPVPFMGSLLSDFINGLFHDHESGPMPCPAMDHRSNAAPNTERLEPHEDADFIDHPFQSPTYKQSIHDTLNKFIERHGGAP